MSKKEPNYFYWGTAIIAIGYSIIYKQFNDIKNGNYIFILISLGWLILIIAPFVTSAQAIWSSARLSLRTLEERVQVWAVRRLHRRLSTLQQKKEQVADPDGYEDLAPSHNVNLEKYSSAMGYALNNPHIFNIAVTGNYGSGKSSILKSYEHEHPEHRYLNISLASFDDSVNNKEETRKLIEVSILQQIFYRVKHSKIPDSRFKRIRKLSHSKQWLLSILALFWVCSLCVLFKVKTFENVVNVDALTGVWPKMIRFVSLALFSIGTIWAVYYLVRPLRNTKLSKLNFVKGDIEIGELGKASILNEYLDEILYFFEVNRYDVVVIEDLDRFNDTAIFTRLRELNSLLNNSNQIGRRIVFIYAIKDEMFLTHNRAKFFEFIVPVIPVINSNNSVDRLFEKLDKAGLRKELSDDVLKAIMLYVDDMRMLKNIVNEYILYKKILDGKLTPDYIFSMVVYKNVEPVDYAELNMNKGLVYQAFQDKQEHIKSLQDQFEDRIKGLEKLILDANKEPMRSVAELRLLYVYHVKQKSQNENIKVDGRPMAINELLSDENFEKIKNSEAKQNINYNWQDIDFKKAEREVDPNQTYQQRENQVLEKRDKYVAGLQQQITELRKDISNIKANTLAELSETTGAGIFSEDLRKKKLLTYLLRNGLLNEEYREYISYFYEGSLTYQDRDFVLSVKNQEPLPADYALTNVDEVASRISLKEYGNPEVMNYHLLDHLLQYQYRYTDELQAINKRLQDDSESSFVFLDAYFTRSQLTSQFIKLLAANWPGFVDFIVDNPEVSAEKRQAYCDAIIRYVPVSNLPALDQKKSLGAQILADKSFLVTYQDPKFHQRIKSVMSSLNIQFEDLEVPGPAAPLFDHIVEQSLFALTPSMVRLILTKHRPESITQEKWSKTIESRNYTAVHDTTSETLLSKVKKNYDTYAERVFLKMDDNTAADSKEIQSFLANDKISMDNRERMFKKQDYVFHKLDNVPKLFWNIALKNNKVKPNWENVMTGLFCEVKIDEPLLQFLNDPNNAKAIAQEQLQEQEDEVENVKESKSTLADHIVSQQGLSDGIYKTLVAAMGYEFPEAHLNGLSKEKILFLINTRKLPPNEHIIAELRSLEEPLHLQLLETATEQFLDHFPDVTLTSTDYALLLRSHEITMPLKMRLLQRGKLSMIEESAALRLSVGDLILEYRQAFDMPLVKTIVGHESDERRKLNIVITQLPFATIESIKEMVALLPEPYNEVLLNVQTKLEAKSKNIEFAKLLEMRGLVTAKQDTNKDVIRIYLKPGAVQG